MNDVRIEIPPKLIPIFEGEARYRGAYGGRGSGKTMTFAKMSAVRAYMFGKAGIGGIILCGREFMNSLEDSSMEEVKQAIRSERILDAYFDIGEKYIRSIDGRIEYKFVGLRNNLDSVKSKARILIAWVDEAENVSEVAWQKLIPTVRTEESEIWVTWNPEKNGSPTDLRFRRNRTPDMLIAEMNYPDNPWFPSVLERERQRDRIRLDDATYRWIWEGAYRENSAAQVFSGKYEVREFTSAPDWNGPYQGIDFGFSKDPTAAIRCWIHDSCLWIEHEAVKVNLELDQTTGFILSGIPAFDRYVTRADSARPESISYLRRYGLPRVVPAQKGKGSIEDGISFIKSFRKVYIHPRCKETLNEFRNYSYKVDRLSGDILPDVVDAFNHSIDSLRYSLEPIMKNRRSLNIRI